MRLKDKKVLIVGVARTGIAVAKFLVARGAKVTITDLKTKLELKAELKSLSALKKIKYELGRHSIKQFVGADLIIVSPGVPSTILQIERALEKNVPVMSELEFTFHFINVPIIAVTGTNGKTTTTMIIGQMLKNANKSVFVGGNIGNALVNVLMTKEKFQYVVAEVSSFQLEFIKEFSPKIAVVLNLSPDHLDRHGNMDVYRTLKGRIFENQKIADSLILNDNDPLVKSYSENAQPRIHYFKIGKLSANQDGISFRNNRFHLKSSKLGNEQFASGKMKVKGDHNRENMMAAILVAKILKLSVKAIQQTIDEFAGIPHRLEYVKTRGYVSFYNDSKATNIDAVRRALESFEEPLILIMGGLDKGAPFEELRTIVQKKVKVLILMGDAKSRINRAIGDYTETFIVGTLDEAAFMAYQKSRSGDIILFSPGCASFDEFKNFEERGERFKELLRDI